MLITHHFLLLFAQNLPSRPRRNRRSETFRSGIRENWLSPAHFILPIFVHEEHDRNEPIASMPGINRLAYGKNVVDHVAEARSLGVNQVVIFPKVMMSAAYPTLCVRDLVFVMYVLQFVAAEAATDFKQVVIFPQGNIDRSVTQHS
jgi:delta-aminolevulinic acid dehydratase/porphobilinogen synthase